jgi:hypothetical protein
MKREGGLHHCPIPAPGPILGKVPLIDIMLMTDAWVPRHTCSKPQDQASLKSLAWIVDFGGATVRTSRKLLYVHLFWPQP